MSNNTYAWSTYPSSLSKGAEHYLPRHPHSRILPLLVINIADSKAGSINAAICGGCDWGHLPACRATQYTERTSPGHLTAHRAGKSPKPTADLCELN